MALLDDVVVVISGAGRGIGRGEAIELARGGARVVVNDVDAEVASAVVGEISEAGGIASAHVGRLQSESRSRRPWSIRRSTFSVGSMRW